MSESSFNRPVSKKDLYGLFVGGILGAFGTTAALASGKDPLIFLLGLATFYPAMALGVCLHEYGHVLGAWSSGGHVKFVQLGSRYAKWKPWKVHFLGVKWLINSAPFSGSAHVVYLEGDHYRLRQCWMIACGPLVNLILLLAGILALYFGHTETARPYLAGWCAAQVVLLFYSLIPRMHKLSGRVQPSDSLLFFKTLHYSDEEIDHAVQLNHASHKLAAENGELEKLDLPALLKKHEAEPGNLAVLWSLSFRLVASHDARCLPYLLQLLHDPRLPAPSLPSIIDIYLTNQLHAGPPENPEAADKLSQRLLEISDTISTRGTRGSVLVDLGRIDEGSTMLQDVLWKTKSELDKTYAHVFLALAEKHRGNLALAGEHAHEAARIAPDSPTLPRVADLLQLDRKAF